VAEEARPPGRVVTFYSYKGGVGRSMALANVAALLAQAGKRVLTVDWDLEAPGLERYFASWLRGSRTTSVGILDLVTAFADGKPLDWRSGLLEAAPLGGPALRVLTAGKADPGYVERLQGLNWEQLFAEKGLGEYLEQLRTEWADEYDFVLVDSRTGITDIGGICTILLPDWIVALFTANEQSVEGVVRVAQMARRMHGSVPRERGRLVIVPVPSRDETRTEREKAERWHRAFAERLGAEFDWLPRGVAPLDAVKQLKLPHVPFWNFGEELPVTQENLAERDTLSAAYAALGRLLGSQLDWSEVVSGAATAGAATVRAEEAQREAKVAQSAYRRSLRWLGAAVLVALLVVGGLLVSWRAQRQQARQVAALLAEAEQLSEKYPELALEKYDQALALGPDSAAARYGRGRRYLETRAPEKAEADFTAAIESAPLDPDAAAMLPDLYLARATARGQQKNLTAALADYSSALTLRPGDAATWATVGATHQQLAEGGVDTRTNLESAVSAYTRALQADPTATGALFNRAVVKERQGDRAGAVADFQAVVASPSSDRTFSQAAAARLQKLAPMLPTPTKVQNAPPRLVVHLKYVAPGDRQVVSDLLAALKDISRKETSSRRARFEFPSQPELAEGLATSEVRYFFPKDEEAALEVRSLVEAELARRGTPLRLVPRLVSYGEKAGVGPGTLEVWLPSLSDPRVQQLPSSRGPTAR
jgi:tetratricopeptide (TPR) repeat protein